MTIPESSAIVYLDEFFEPCFAFIIAFSTKEIPSSIGSGIFKSAIENS